MKSKQHDNTLVSQKSLKMFFFKNHAENESDRLVPDVFIF